LGTFVQIDNELKRVAEEVKSLKANKIALEQDISSQMVQNQIEEIDCKDKTKVKIYTKKSSPNVFTKPNVLSCATTLFGPEKAAALVALVEERKVTKETTGIKRMASVRNMTAMSDE